jgi:hypothetical protein
MWNFLGYSINSLHTIQKKTVKTLQCQTKLGRQCKPAIVNMNGVEAASFNNI